MSSINNQPSFKAMVRVQGLSYDLVTIPQRLKKEANKECAFLNATNGFASQPFGRVYDVYYATGEEAAKLDTFKKENNLTTQSLDKLSDGKQVDFYYLFKGIKGVGQDIEEAVKELLQ
jgi:hypothetical protein